jgi:hypothetical protein
MRSLPCELAVNTVLNPELALAEGSKDQSPEAVSACCVQTEASADEGIVWINP